MYNVSKGQKKQLVPGTKLLPCFHLKKAYTVDLLSSLPIGRSFHCFLMRYFVQDVVLTKKRPGNICPTDESLYSF